MRANIHREALAEYTELLELAASTKTKLAEMIRSNEDSARGTEDEIYEAIQNIHVAQAGLLEARQYHALMQALLKHKQAVQSATIATDAAESYVTLISRLPEPLGEPCNKLLSMMQEQCTAPRATRGSITAALQCAQWLLGDTDKLMELYLECLKVVANTVE